MSTTTASGGTARGTTPPPATAPADSIDALSPASPADAVALMGAASPASAPTPPSPGATRTEPAERIDGAALGRLLDGRWWQVRREARDLALDPAMQKIEGLPLAEHRERALAQIQDLARRGVVHRAYPAAFGGGDDPGASLAAFEELVAADPSIQIKAGVQWGLFGAAVLHLGTDEHHARLLPGILDLTVPGCFAMTEIGHGSDVASIATTATYDAGTEEFVLTTPVVAARKEYIGNAAVHGRAAVVFAQLVTKGVNHGVHAFYVPIRAEVDDGEPTFLPGVAGRDDGLKGGLGGVDNGQLWFDHVRVPRANLLNRYGDVAPDGTYSSPIASPGRRFFAMLGTLVQGRVSLSGAALVAAKMAMAIAVTYGTERRQFTGADEHNEVVLLDYQQHQRRLLPLLARTYAATFAHHQMLDRFHEVFSGAHDTDADRQDLETLAAAAKPLTTWLALDALQEAREACGGAGYMAENRLVGLRQDMDVYVTFEGDNNVLLQLVGKRLLTDYGKEMARIDIAGAARYVAARAADMTLHRTPLRRAAQSILDTGSRARSAGHLRAADTQRELLEDRVEAMVAEIATALRPARTAPAVEAAALFNAHQHDLIEAARAHGELMQWEAFTAALTTVRDPHTREVLGTLRDLFGLTLIEKNLAWYLMNGRLTAQRAKTVTSYVDRLLVRLRPHATDLVEAFGYTPAHLRATIATGVETERQQEARAYYRRLRAAGQEPVNEKELHASQQKSGLAQPAD
ncbi:acyl-CoA dehydrogenase [Georgenia yuyongxinii]|uniref:acyl-CoA oxidase n=1 Tax=Georgenia yuyongxinii TaxID=2589797 RepID=A0A5B8C5U5_9MICO|nr:acyl-CoA dehydrogenase [Georgenia yuyongxinii]QDC26089.1 acyl-CoA dehydrogenase [Georgenia yuyongxinii]